MTFGAAQSAQAFVASLMDSALQPNRVEWLNRMAARAWTEMPAAAAIVVSVGSVEAAVLDQQARIEGLARQANGVMSEVAHDRWPRHGAGPDSSDVVTLRVGTLPSVLADSVTGLERAAADVAPAATLSHHGLGRARCLAGRTDRSGPRGSRGVASREHVRSSSRWRGA